MYVFFTRSLCLPYYSSRFNCFFEEDCRRGLFFDHFLSTYKRLFYDQGRQHQMFLSVSVSPPRQSGLKWQGNSNKSNSLASPKVQIPLYLYYSIAQYYSLGWSLNVGLLFPLYVNFRCSNDIFFFNWKNIKKFFSFLL